MADFTPVGVTATVDGLNTFSRDIGTINKNIGSVGDTANKVGSSLGGFASNLGSAAAAAGKTLVAGAAAATAAVGALGLAVGGISFNFAQDIDKNIKLLQSQLGVTAEEAEALGGVVRNVFGNNFGESISDATAAVAIVRQQLGALSNQELQQVTENAFRIRDTFGIDVSESLNAVKVLTEQFGISTQEAFDFITSGFQRGLNSSDDFLDTVTEYGNLFSESGATAGEFFSVLETGLQGGVLGTDKAADAFKEFQIRFREGGDDVSAAFEAMGQSWDEWVEDALNPSSDFRAIDAFQDLIKEIENIEDPIKRNAASVAIFGTQFEDLGESAVSAINTTQTSLSELAGATSDLDVQYETLGAKFEGVKRQFLLAFEPMGRIILELAEEAFPLVESSLAAVTTALGGVKSWLESNKQAIKDAISVTFGEIVIVVRNIGEAVIPALVSAFGTIKTWFDDNKTAIQTAINTVFGGINTIIKTITDTVIPALVEAFNNIVDWFTTNKAKTNTLIDEVLGESGLGEILRIITEDTIPALVEAFNNIAKWFTNNGPALQRITENVFGAMATIVKSMFTPNGGIIGGVITALTNIVKWFNANQAPITRAINEIVAIMEGLSVAINGIAQTFDDAWRLVIQPTITGIGEAIGELFNLVIALIDKDWVSAMDSIEALFYGVFGANGTVVSVLKGFVKILSDIVLAGIDGILTAVGESREELIQAWIGVWDNIVKAIKLFLGIDSPSRVFMDITNSIIDAIIKVLSDNVSKVRRAAENLANGIVNGIKGIIQDIKNTAQEIVDAFLGIFSSDDVLSSFVTIGENIVAGLVKGINNKAESFKDATLNLATQALKVVKNFFGIGSPSRVFIEIGEDIMEGLRIGMSNGSEAVISVAVDTINTIANTAQTATSILQGFLSDGGTILEKAQGTLNFSDFLFGFNTVSQTKTELEARIESINETIEGLLEKRAELNLTGLEKLSPEELTQEYAAINFEIQRLTGELNYANKQLEPIFGLEETKKVFTGQKDIIRLLSEVQDNISDFSDPASLVGRLEEIFQGGFDLTDTLTQQRFFKLLEEMANQTADIATSQVRDTFNQTLFQLKNQSLFSKLSADLKIAGDGISDMLAQIDREDLPADMERLVEQFENQIDLTEKARQDLVHGAEADLQQNLSSFNQQLGLLLRLKNEISDPLQKIITEQRQLEEFQITNLGLVRQASQKFRDITSLFEKPFELFAELPEQFTGGLNISGSSESLEGLGDLIIQLTQVQGQEFFDLLNKINQEFIAIERTNFNNMFFDILDLAKSTDELTKQNEALSSREDILRQALELGINLPNIVGLGNIADLTSLDIAKIQNEIAKRNLINLKNQSQTVRDIILLRQDELKLIAEQQRLEQVESASTAASDRLSFLQRQNDLINKIISMGVPLEEFFGTSRPGSENLTLIELLEAETNLTEFLVQAEEDSLKYINERVLAHQKDLALEQEMLRVQNKQDEAQRQRDRLSFLQRQNNLIDSIIQNGLSVTQILGDIQLGEDLDITELLTAEGRLTEYLISQERQRLGLIKERVDEHREELRLARQQATLTREQERLNFLNQQKQLLADIASNELDSTSILQGFQLGVDADQAGFLKVLTRFTQAMIAKVEDDLGIASPSKVFARIGSNVMAGLTQGIMGAMRLPQAAMTQAMQAIVQPAAMQAPNVNTTVNQTNNYQVSSDMDMMRVSAQMNRALGMAIS